MHFSFLSLLFCLFIIQTIKGGYMKKIILSLLVLTISFSLFAMGAEETNDGSIRIGVSKLMSHAALDAAEKGMKDYLDSTGLDITYDFQNANGDISSAGQIAQKFKDDGADIVVGVATPTAQALANVFMDTPVVFTAITDPVDAGLMSNVNGDEGSNIAGVSDLSPVEEQIKLFMDITGAKTIGNVYASGEANGVVLMNLAKEAVEKNGGTFVEAAVANTSEVMMATQSIIDRVDAVYIATDNTVIAALASVAEVCKDSGKPLFSADPSGVEGLDVLISWGFDYYSIGTETGKVIEKILSGQEPGNIGTVYLTDPADFELWFNLDNAKDLGIEIADEYLDMAAVIIENGQKTEK